MWSTADDALLKSLVDKYPNNWPLIAECYNASRLTAPTDRRTPSDCLERWKGRWGSERKPFATETTHSQVDDHVASGSGQMTTRGVKRLASASISSPVNQGVVHSSESKKKRRHILLQESMRRAAKKRGEAAQKALSKSPLPTRKILPLPTMTNS